MGVFEYDEKKWKAIVKKHPNTYRNCVVCNKRVVLCLCKDDLICEPYCEEHCPKHIWQSGIDWGTECGICGLKYIAYLKDLLEKNDIPFDNR